MKDKILLTIINSEKPLSMSEIAEKTKEDIQLINYHLKNLVKCEDVVCEEKEGRRYYSAYPIVKESKLYEAVMGAMTIAVPEFYEELGDKKKAVNAMRQVMMQVMDDVEKDTIS